MKRRTSPPWFPLWVDKWLFGSTRIELKPDERGVWVDLMALGQKDDGYIRANEIVPYGIEQLSGMLCIDQELLKRTINRCIVTGKLEETEHHTMRIINHDAYQLTGKRIHQIEQENAKISLLGEHMGEKRETKIKSNSEIKSKIKNNIKIKEGEVLPFPSDSFSIAWNNFVEHRREIKKPITARASTMLLKKLSEMSKDESEAIKILEQSIMNGWQGIFPPKENYEGNRNNTKRGAGGSAPTINELKRSAEIARRLSEYR